MKISFITRCSLVAAALLTLATYPAAANNLQVGNVRLANHDAFAKTMDVVFNLQWDNSWRGTYDTVESWDAAWVFVKFKAPGATDWTHAWLSTSPNVHTAPDGVVDVGTTPVSGTDRGMGAFVYSSAPRAGGVIYSSTRLKWDYGAQGYNFGSGGDIQVSVLAIEMAHVAEGAFWAGNTNAVIFNSFRDEANAASPARIASEDAQSVFYGTNTPPASYALPAAFPKGHKGFYCMKYMVTQGQYSEFLNMQTRARQAQLCSAVTQGRYMNDDDTSTAAQNWNTVYVADATADPLPRVYAAAEPELLCNWIGWDDGIRYAAWAGLRPMTELEFEKAARGPLDPVEHECVWGDTMLAVMYRSSPDVSNGREIAVGSGRSSAGWSPDNSANAAIRLPAAVTSQMPRAGIFATATSSRRQSGASYWGIMELGSGLIEAAVSPRDATGLAFTGAHGDGTLAVPAGWPPVGYGSTAGIARRGSGWYYLQEDATVASRRLLAHGGARSMHVGWRAVRSAP